MLDGGDRCTALPNGSTFFAKTLNFRRDVYNAILVSAAFVNVR